MADVPGQYPVRNYRPLRPIEIRHSATNFTDEMPMCINAGVVTGAGHMVEPMDEAGSGKLVQNPINTLPGNGRQGLLDVLPRLIDTRMIEICGNKIVDGETLRSALPAILCTNFFEFSVVIHLFYLAYK